MAEGHEPDAQNPQQGGVIVDGEDACHGSGHCGRLEGDGKGEAETGAVTGRILHPDGWPWASTKALAIHSPTPTPRPNRGP